ncbi:hypothetical protein FRC01_001006 [Tulasnella sp. 417]|nr:hypothetical protein FRC01_001006 [Tulasnella sp. 417]
MSQATLPVPTSNGLDLANQPMDLQRSATHSRSPLEGAEPQPLSIQILPSELDPEVDMSIRTAVNDPPQPQSGGTNRSIEVEPPLAVVVPVHQPTSALRRLWTRGRMSVPHTLRVFFTAEGRELRHVTGIFFRLIFSLVQVVAVTVILALAGSKFRSKLDPEVSEFEDCDKLGIWNALWAARAAFGAGMVVWEWKRYSEKRMRAQRRRTATDIELGPVDDSDHQLQWGTEVRGPPESTPSSTLGTIPSPDMPSSSRSQGAEPLPPQLPPSPQANTASSTRANQRRPPPREPPSTADGLFDRLDTFLTATGLIHFVVNHIWLYTTVHTCRINDPHIWYLGLGIASLGYLIVLELLLIAFIVFVLGPILLLILNLIMLCLGRPVDRHGNVIVRPEIPSMDQSLIDKIPLVVFVPPLEPEAKLEDKSAGASEPREPPRKEPGNPADGAGSGETSAAKKIHGTPSTAASRPARSRFAWSRKRGAKGKPADLTMWSDATLISEGDPRFEKSEHPFVQLESNRAQCYICLSEFVEPKRKEGVPPAPPRPKTPEPIAAPVEAQSSTPQVEDDDEAERGSASHDVPQPKGKEPIREGPAEVTPEPEEDLGTPGEPLRLLACGHVFHKHCLDPWLSKTSGRCPVCNRKVEIPAHMQ